MLGIGAAAMVSRRSWQNTMQIRDRVNVAYSDAAKLINQMHQLEAKKRKMLEKANLTVSLLERVPRSYLLGALTNALPKGASLEKFDLDTEKVITQDTQRGKNSSKSKKFSKAQSKRQKAQPPKLVLVMEVTGRAGTDVEVAKLITNLAHNPLTDSVDLVYSKEKLINKVAVREFQVEIKLKHDADVIDALREANVKTKPLGMEIAKFTKD